MKKEIRHEKRMLGCQYLGFGDGKALRGIEYPVKIRIESGKILGIIGKQRGMNLYGQSGERREYHRVAFTRYRTAAFFCDRKTAFKLALANQQILVSRGARIGIAPKSAAGYTLDHKRGDPRFPERTVQAEKILRPSRLRGDRNSCIRDKALAQTV